MKTAITLIVFVAGLVTVEPHGFIKFPLSRTSIWRDARFASLRPVWWDDSGVWCGNVQQDLNYTTCGRCGDTPGNSDFVQGGRYDHGIITGTFTAGQVVETQIEFIANHRGHFEFELCPQVTENDHCFQRLSIVGGDREIRNNDIMCSGYDLQNGLVRALIQLPAGVRCTRCTLRWTYRTSYAPAPDACWQPYPTQTFRNCVDIRID